ncbi:hypothetical protein [Sphingobacterium faecium]|uniref:hypothetical protein n=1 Tax=Sphingobacterium faecium TaxID=34087 RepID=UPI00320B95F6
MRKYQFLVLFLSIILSCCKQDSIETKNVQDSKNDFSIEAKAFLKSKVKNTNGTDLILSLKNNLSSVNFVTDGELFWSGKSEYRIKSIQGLEVPYFTKRNTINLYNLRKSFYEETARDKEQRVNFSYTNMLFSKVSDDSNLQAIFVTYIPDIGVIKNLDYFKTGSRMTLNSIDHNFNGYIEYKSLDNQVLAVFYLEQGKVRTKYSVDDQPTIAQRGANSTSLTCQTVCTPVYGTICVTAPERGDGGEICTLKVVGQSCKQVCTGTDPNPEYPNPGGQAPGQQTYPTAKVKDFIVKVFEPCDDFKENTALGQKFESEMTDLLSGNSGESFVCFTEKMLEFLSTNDAGLKISLCLNATANQATYNPITKKLGFKDEINIDSRNIFHELFHAVQDRIYPNGISQYLSVGKAEIEFETHLFIDLVGRLVSNPPIALYDTEDNYKNFLNGLTTDNNGNRNLYNARNYFNSDSPISQSYNTYKAKFKERYSAYNSPNSNLAPLAITHFLNNFNCYL